MDNYYVYLHIKKTTGEPFYVGKGTKLRYKSKQNRSNWWNNTVNKYGYDIIFLEEGLSNQQSIELEIYWINRIGRKDLGLGPLINLTDGGEGTIGKVYTPEYLRKLSEAKKGKKLSTEHRLNISKSNTGRKQTNNTKLLIGNKNKGNIKFKNGKYKEIAVVLTDINDNIIKTYDNHHILAEELNTKPSMIIYVCNGNYKTHKGYKIKFR